jgi:hypothetical protein
MSVLAFGIRAGALASLELATELEGEPARVLARGSEVRSEHWLSMAVIVTEGLCCQWIHRTDQGHGCKGPEVVYNTR